jgi:putative membrane protein insertion efficiency factor
MKNLLLKFIKIYQKVISPVKRPCCRFYPTCSNYAIEAIENFGILKAVFKIIFRILKCNPFFKGGYDPVYKK